MNDERCDCDCENLAPHQKDARSKLSCRCDFSRYPIVAVSESSLEARVLPKCSRQEVHDMLHRIATAREGNTSMFVAERLRYVGLGSPGCFVLLFFFLFFLLFFRFLGRTPFGGIKAFSLSCRYYKDQFCIPLCTQRDFMAPVCLRAAQLYLMGNRPSKARGLLPRDGVSKIRGQTFSSAVAHLL